MQHYDVILFDVDGTLIDSAPGILNTLEEVFRKMNVDITGVDLRRYLGPPLRKTFAEYFTDPAKVEEAAGSTVPAMPSRAATSAACSPVRQRCSTA